MTRLLIMALLLTFWRVDAATVTANSASVADVQTAYNSLYPQAQTDKVIIPAGSATWTSTLRITNGCMMFGSGPGVTTISQSGSTKSLVRISGTGRFTFGNCTINEAGPNSATSGMFDINGPGDWRFCSNTVTLANAAENCLINAWDSSVTRGLIDRNRFTHTGSNPSHIVTVFGDFDSVGADDWLAGTTYGTTNYIYIEHNAITFNALSDGFLDAFAGAKFVVRFNQCTNTYFGWHGTDSGGYRSPHSYEIYGNHFEYNGGNSGYYCVFNSRGGTGLVFSNTVVGHTAVGTDFLLQYFRATGSYAPWGQMTGSNPYDGNEDGTGYPGLDQQGMTGPTSFGGMNSTQVHSRTYVWNNDASFSTVADDSCIVNGRDYTNISLVGYVPLGVHPFADGPASSPPAAPSGLSATAISSAQINLDWTDNSSDEEGFEIRRDTDSGFGSAVITGGLSADSTSYGAAGLAAGTLYYFAVRATNAAGASSWSSSANATTATVSTYRQSKRARAVGSLR